LDAFELNLEYLEFIRTRNCAAQARLSAGAATRHCRHGPPVSPLGLPCSPSMASPVPDGRGPLPAARRRARAPSPSFSLLRVAHAALPPSFSFHYNATTSLSLSLLRFKRRRSIPRSPFHPVPLSSNLEHRHPLLSRAAGSRDRSQASDTAPPRRIWSHHCRHLGFTVSSTSPGFSAQFFLRASPPLCVPVLQVPPSPSIDHRSSSLTPERYCLASTLPPLRRAAASMSPTRPLHAQRLPLSAPVLHAQRLPFGLSAITCRRPRGRRGCSLGLD
jgi:hypothetical protein